MDLPSPDRVAPIAYLPTAVLRSADDAALARSLRLGDPRAEREAWRRFRPMVFRIALYATGSRALAAELAGTVLESFLSGVAEASSTDAENLTALVLSLLTRTLRRRLRWSGLLGRRQAPANEVTPTLAEARGDRTIQAAVGRFLVVAADLSPLARTAFVLHYLEARELEEVAAAIGKSVRSTRQLLRRAWQSLAARVGRDPALADILPTLPADSLYDGDDRPMP